MLDCGGGPASFTAEWNARGRRVIALDPSYQYSAAAIASQFEETAQRMLEGMETAHPRFRWDLYKSEANVVRIRREALSAFLADIRRNSQSGSYCAGQLPHLPFADGAFDLALSSHLLFLYSDDLDEAGHLSALRELLRVSTEVRVFPLLDLDGNRSRHLEPVCTALAGEARVEVVDVPFEFQLGATQMLSLRRH